MKRVALGVIAVGMVGCASPFSGPGPVFPVSAEDRAGTDSFPQALRETTLRCGVFGVGGGQREMSRVTDWYGGHLRAAGETPLFRSTGSSLRFTWLRSFDAPVVIRLETGADGAVTMTATELSGRGGYEPGSVARRIERRLTAGEVTALARMMAQSGVLKQTAATCDIGLDGAGWAVESAGADGYRFIERQSPADGPVRTFGLHLIGLTGWTYDRVY
ncbi:hypothetical protein [Brevundimonas sp. FT23028]|uniref:hypothetical protein n=1 Tax=Brevundimonas sp. FT23028 TaxID=3393748 RepID=UPI003B586160